MASFGAKYMRVAPFKGAELETALPTYDPPVTLGKLIKTDTAIKLASAELFADNALAEELSEFASATVTVETDDVIDTVAAVIYGSTLSTDELADGGNDQVPYVGLGYYKDIVREGVKSLKCIYFPKAKAALGNDTAATKGSSITFGTSTTVFTVFAPKYGAWRYRAEFTGATAEADAKAWIDGKLGVAAAEATQAEPETKAAKTPAAQPGKAPQ